MSPEPTSALKRRQAAVYEETAGEPLDPNPPSGRRELSELDELRAGPHTEAVLGETAGDLVGRCACPL
jgi:hypothetical protein